MIAIQLQQVTKVYRKGGEGIRALDGVALAVEAGQFVVIRGPSGSGKTTLLLTVGGMIRPTRGRVFLDGQDVYALPPRARGRLRAEKIGFVFQLFHLVPYLTAVENVMLPSLAGASVGYAEARQLLERLALPSACTTAWLSSASVNVNEWPWLERS